jgi:hypothetical protein
MMYPKPKTYRSKKYLEFIRTKRCIVCGYDQTVPHHEPLGHGGKGIKAPDSFTLPMCHLCHNYRHQQGFVFWEENNIDPKLEIIKLLTEYLHEKGI